MQCPLDRQTACAIVAASAFTAPAIANDDPVARYLRSQLGTISASASSQFADGKLYACIVEFAHVAQDWAYRQGGFVRVGGSFGVMSAAGKLGATLKVIVHDIDTPSLQMKPAAPANAYFVSKTTSSRAYKVSSYPSDTPGGFS
jgi:hypothetical protein